MKGINLPFLTRLVVVALALLAAPSAHAAQEAPAGVAITFDDLPFVDAAPEDPANCLKRISRLAKTLRKNRIPAVGFVNEQRLYQLGQVDKTMLRILDSWLDNGLELGNHGYSHRSLNKLPPGEFKKEVVNGERITRPLVKRRGGELRYFRFPYLHVGQTLARRREAEALLKELNYTVAPITISINDWSFSAAYEKVKNRGNKKLEERITKAYLAHVNEAVDYAEELAYEIFGRPIRHVIGLHANTLNADHFDKVTALLRQRGFKFLTLDEALQDSAYSSLDTYHGPMGESWLYHWAVSVGLHPVDEPKVPNFVIGIAGPSAYQR